MVTLHKKHFLIIGVIILGLILGYTFWPKHEDPKPHQPVRTFAVWFSNPAIEKDTQALCFRLDYDTLSPYKKWKPRYYVPVAKLDSGKTPTGKDTVYHHRLFLLLDDTLLIHDFDKHY